jgi:uncharacterized membrane protein (DUF4010 family)
MARLARDSAAIDLAARAVVIAAVTNTVVKAGMVIALGSRDLARRIVPAAMLILVAGLVSAFL